MKWISVKDKLPEQGKLVLASLGKNPEILFLNQLEQWSDPYDDGVFNPTHWMPLPAPPIDLMEFTETIGNRIMEWVEKKFTFENNLKRPPNQDDFDDFGFEEIPWMFTQKGQRLYESYLRKAQRLIERNFPNEEYEDLERYTGVIYP